MGNVVDFRKCESLDRCRQKLTYAERERLEELLRAAANGRGVRRNRAVGKNDVSAPARLSSA
jgi:hypothetical protein